jgi:hypothetical protein
MQTKGSSSAVSAAVTLTVSLATVLAAVTGASWSVVRGAGPLSEAAGAAMTEEVSARHQARQRTIAVEKTRRGLLVFGFIW